MRSCLQVKVTKVTENMYASANQLCGTSVLKFFPLFVEEGYLFVEVDGKIAKIYVNKYEYDE